MCFSMFQKAAEASALQAAKSVENSIRKKHNDKKVKEKDASGNLQVGSGIFIVMSILIFLMAVV